MTTDTQFLGTGWAFPPSFDWRSKEATLVSQVEDIEQSLRILIGTVDTFMVAHVSDGAVAALGVSNRLVMLGLIGFNFIGIGTSVVTSADAPSLDAVYKLQEYAGKPRRKRSAAKATWPGRKQVYRRYGADGRKASDWHTDEGDAAEDAESLDERRRPSDAASEPRGRPWQLLGEVVDRHAQAGPCGAQLGPDDRVVGRLGDEVVDDQRLHARIAQDALGEQALGVGVVPVGVDDDRAADRFVSQGHQ